MSNIHTARHVLVFEPAFKLISLTNADAEINERDYRKAVERITFNKKKFNERYILPEFSVSAAFLLE